MGRVHRAALALGPTTGAGAATSANSRPLFGEVVGISYKPGDIDTGATVALVDVQTGATLWSKASAGTANVRVRPTGIIVGATGAAISASTSATGVDQGIYVGGPVKATVVSGGDSKSGTLYVDVLTE